MKEYIEELLSRLYIYIYILFSFILTEELKYLFELKTIFCIKNLQKMRTRTTRPEYPWNADRSVQQILPYLYQAGEEILDDDEFLKNHNIAYILSVTTTITPETNDKRFEYCMHIKVEDDKSAEIATHFKSAIEFITYARTESKAVVVHCQQGVSRSGAVILAYLIFQLKLRYIKHGIMSKGYVKNTLIQI